MQPRGPDGRRIKRQTSHPGQAAPHLGGSGAQTLGVDFRTDTKHQDIPFARGLIRLERKLRLGGEIDTVAGIASRGTASSAMRPSDPIVILPAASVGK